jgi:hypothetical protein
MWNEYLWFKYDILFFKYISLARRWWLMSIILAMQVAEIRRVSMRPGQFERSCLKNTQHRRGWQNACLGSVRP